MRHSAATKSKKRKPNIAGIVGFAAELGCNRDHLRRVINGDIVSKRLLSRFLELQARRDADANQPAHPQG